MPTIKDVAQAAGISVTTVSRALNNHSDVAKETRERVARIASQMDYHPNHTARSLQGTRTDTIGLVIPQLLHQRLDSFWLEFIGGASSACTAASLDLLLTTGRDLPSELAHYQRLVRSHRVDGAIVCDVRVRDPRIQFLCQGDAPFVAFGRTMGDGKVAWIDVDGAAGVRLAVEHLVALGHRRIAYLGTHRAFSFSHFRYEGYLDALLAANLPYDEALVLHGLDQTSELAGPLGRLVALPDPPTALLACADFLALGALRALRVLDCAVPGTISVVAFDDTPVTQQADPPLTSIRQDNHAIGTRVVQLLVEQLAGEVDSSRALPNELIQPVLIPRQSTVPPRSVADRTGAN